MMLRDFRDFDDLFDGFFSGYFPASLTQKRESGLLFDIADDGKEITLTTDLPGVNKDDIEVEYKDRALSVKGKKTVAQDEKRRYFLKERSSMNFDRSFHVPYEIKTEGISCQLENGVLTISLPKSEEHAPRKISIQ